MALAAFWMHGNRSAKKFLLCASYAHERKLFRWQYPNYIAESVRVPCWKYPFVSPRGFAACNGSVDCVRSSAHFEDVLVKSILAHEQPNAKNVGDQVTLTWNFGQNFPSAVVLVDPNQPSQSWSRHQGCEVDAKKKGDLFWEVYHMKKVII
jgi:hypothetical protein